MAFIKNISPNQSTDNELIAAFKASGEIHFLSTLFIRYVDLVFGVCLKYFKDTERSKDAVMDIFTELNSKLKLHEVEHFKAWLHVLTRNYCLMQLRRAKNMKTTEFNPIFVYSENYVHLNDEVFEKEENLNQLTKCIEGLPKEQGQSIKLFYLESKCYHEIVSITGYEWNQVRSYVQNGKRNLKICMEEKRTGI